jgi:hypothetical protein
MGGKKEAPVIQNSLGYREERHERRDYQQADFLPGQQ